MAEGLYEREVIRESIEQDIVPFYGKPIIVVTLEDGSRAVVLRWICEGLEIDTQAQVRRLRRSPTTMGDVWTVRVETDGGRQPMPALNFKIAAYWLATINPMHFPEGVRRDTIILFQRECIDVLYEHFAQKASFRHAIMPSSQALETTVQDVAALREQYGNLLGVVNLMREHLEMATGAISGKLDDVIDLFGQIATTQARDIARLDARASGLTRQQKAKVSEAVKIIVRDSRLAGSPLDFVQVYGALNRRFNAASYGDIPDIQYEAVLSFLRQLWQNATSGQLPEQAKLFDV